MPFTLTMPKLSPTMEAGTITKWHKKVGEHASEGDLLFEVATDKATVEYSALDEGWLRQIIVNNGEEAHVNQPVAIFTEEKEEKFESYKAPTAPPSPVKEPAETKEAKKGTEAPAIKAGTVMQQPAFVPEAPLADYAFEYPTQALEKRVLASPLAKKLAKEKGVDLTTVQGTGPNQRIMSRDLSHAQTAGVVTFGQRETPTIAPGTYEEEALSPMRKVIGQRLQESKSFIPHFYVQIAVSADALTAAREQLKSWGISVTFNDFIIRACALALKQHPNINSGFHSVNQSIIRFKTIDIAVAVGMEEGLITPIIRHADFKNLGEISVEVKNLAKLAREGKLEPHQYKGGSFTITNLGMYGVDTFQAIINPPQAAILAVSAIQEVPVVSGGSVVPGKVMNLTLSVDHRVIDGVSAAQFLRTLQHSLENPAGLLVV